MKFFIGQRVSWEEVKSKALKKLRKLKKLDQSVKRERLRRAESYLFQVLKMKGNYTEAESDRVVDAYIDCHEREGSHPLQTKEVYATIRSSAYGVAGRKQKFWSMKRSVLFAHPPLKQALARRGFHLNHGSFSASESLKLMNNFEEFLSSRGFPTDPSSVWKLIKEDFGKFFQDTKLFLYVGDGLNRTSDQLYVRLFSLYHTCKRNKTSAAEDGYILEQGNRLQAVGFHRRFKSIGDDLDRFSVNVQTRYKTINSTKSSAPASDEDILNKIANIFGCSISSIDMNRNIPFETVAEELGCSAETLEQYWIKEGKQKYLRSKLPRWKLEDSILLLDKIQVSGEDDENCIDFDSIYKESFCNKVENWKHLREHYTRIRRVVPYYMLDDLQSVVTVAKRDLLGKLSKRNCTNETKVDDEDLFGPESS